MELAATAPEDRNDVGTLWTVTRSGHRARCALISRRQDWEIRVLVDGVPLLTKRCVRGAETFALAEALKQRMVADGWRHVAPDPFRRAS